MPKVTLGEMEVELSASIAALVIYEQEFSTRDRRADLIQDVFGKQTVDESDSGGRVVFDFTAVNWTALARAVWAMAKAADESTAPFPRWSAVMTGLNLYEMSDEVMDIIVDGFFRPAPAAPAE